MDRREFVLAATAAVTSTTTNGAAAAAPAHTALPPSAAVPPSAPPELTELAAAMAEGKLNAVALTQTYLGRIAALDRQGPGLNAVLETNPQALEIAAALDAERRTQGPRGPLHGIPILIKDNIETQDRMMTTAGSLALEGWYAPEDAPVIARLRAAGMVIIGKTNLSEWANFRSTHSASGWSGRGGQTRNPHALNRSPSGSSSGSAVAVAADLCAIAVGTETDGSIVSPASINGIVGIKPTVGLVSRRGIVPISHSQDTAGPLARGVRDAALLLGALAAPDPADPASAPVSKFETDYTRYLNLDGLRGARLGIARKFFAENAPLDAFLDRCVQQLKDAGAIIVDPADLPQHGAWSEPEGQVLLYEFKADLNTYLARLPATFPARTLDALIRFNTEHAARELPYFDQELLRESAAKGDLGETAYLTARAACLAATRANGIDAVLAEHNLDALVSLTAGPAWLIDHVNGDGDSGGCSSPAAVAGYPHVTVPAGEYKGLPIGLSFFGTAFSEPLLIRLASGYEHVAGPRSMPRYAPSV
jgi:amidase